MDSLSAVIFVPDDTSKTGYPQPLMLQRVLGAPLLAWLADAMFDSGVGRFFLVCRERFAEAACACLPAEAEVTTAADSNPSDLLHVFLSTANESEREITIVAGPAVYVPSLARRSGAPLSSCVRRADRVALMAALDDNASFIQFLSERCAALSDYDGYFSVDTPAAALSLAKLLQRDRALRLMKQGVEVVDPDNCYIEPTVRIASGVRLLPGTILRGRTVVDADAVIGPWSTVENARIGEGAVVACSQLSDVSVGRGCTVGPYAHLRPGTVLEAGAKIGSFVEVKNAHIGENTWASHLSYLGDADIGSGCNIGCGAATVNFDRAEKHRTTIGDDAFIGCNVSLVAPLKVGDGAYVAAGSTVTEDVPEQALGIARARQSNKKDWAAKHKKR